MEHSEDIPQAKIASRRAPYASRIWLLTIACLALAIGLVVYSSRTGGVPIVVRFQDGHGVSAGDRLKYRGIAVGEVVAVELGEAFDQVNVTIDVDQAAQGIARQGSLFWIERPVVRLTEVRGLETLLSGTHIGVLPGPPDAGPQHEFTGLEIAPTGDLPEGGLEILLESPRIGGLARGVPIKYRGMKIGHIVSVGLASDAATVEARGFIEPEYRHLVRANSKFWNHDGVDFSLGLTGLQVEADSLASIAFGGIELATPDPPGETVNTGQRFSIFDEPLEEWLASQPNLSANIDLLPDGKSLPSPIRIAKLWKERSFGIKRSRSRHGWALPLTDGRLLGPADMLTPVENALDEETFLEISGERVKLTSDGAQSSGRMAFFLPSAEINLPEETWPTERTRVPEGPEDCLLVSAHDAVQILAEARLTKKEDDWEVNVATPLDSDLHGVSVIAISDGSLVGILVFEDGRALVATIVEPMLAED